MKVVNIEKLAGHKRIVMTGREEHVELVASKLVESKFRDILYCPQREDYFLDYPDIIKDLQKELDGDEAVVVVTTQSKEFLDCLLESDFEFVLATVRKYGDDPDDLYRLRVMSKEEALADRRNFDMELRV